MYGCIMEQSINFIEKCLPPANGVEGGNLFSRLRLSVYLSLYVTITHDALDLTVQPPQLQAPLSQKDTGVPC